MKPKNYKGVGVYEHYKGGRYTVIGIATHEETGELLVIYIPFGEKDNRKHWAREFGVFDEDVAPGVPRFKWVSP